MKPITPTLRWTLFGLLCVAGIFNAMDRPVIAILKPFMSADFGWTDKDYGDLAFLTQMIAAFSFLVTGWLVDRYGVRRSMVAGVSTWSAAALAHGWAMTAWQVVGARIGLGATEAVQTPLTIKTVTTLFEPDKRSFAFGVGTAIAGAGTIATLFLIPVLLEAMGWRGALIFAGASGFVALVLWLFFARGISFDEKIEHPKNSIWSELRSFLNLPLPEMRSLLYSKLRASIVFERNSWAIGIAKALSDATWWLMGFWLPDFYRKTYALTTEELAVPLSIAFIGSGGGAFLFGWLSTRLLERGWSVNRVRKTVMLVSALIVLPLPLVLSLNAFWPVAIMMGLVMAGHQGFSLSIFSTITDVTPAAKVARVTAFGAFMGNMAGAAISKITGLVLVAGLGFTPLFLFAAVSYLLALAWLHLLMPEIRRA
jgi:MFS transporter, ACS family, hexuronate transporter